MPEPELDARVLAWLGEDRGGASAWVLPSVLAHVRRHRRRRASVARLIEGLRWPSPLPRRLTLALELAVVASLLIVGAGLLALGAGGRRPAPAYPASPSPAATAVTSPETHPTPIGLAPGDLIDAYRLAWNRGDVSVRDLYLVPGAGIDAIGSDRRYPDAYFAISTGRGWLEWQRRGAFANGGALWAHAASVGVGDPFTGYEGFSVYRVAADGRIGAIWVVLGTAATMQGQDAAPPAPPSAPPEVVAFLDGCLDALNRRDAGAFGRCYATDGESFLSADAAPGSWTDHYAGSASIGPAVDSLGSDDRFVRTGQVLSYADMAVYPFRLSSGGTCTAGIDAFLLTPDHRRIQTHWAICGPAPG